MRESAVVLCSDDLMLSGEMYMPDDCEKTYPALCLCHGIPAAKYNPEEKGGYSELASRFCQAGFVTLAFNFRGCGPSQGNFDMLGWTEDLGAALDFLCMVPEVDKERICLLGSSGGAATSVYVAAHDKRVSALATFACPARFDFADIGHDTDSVLAHFRGIDIIKDPDFPPSQEKWLEGFKTVRPQDYIDKISPRPLLIVQGETDEVVALEHARSLYEKAGNPKELVVVPGAGHRLRQDERAVKAAMQWLVRQAAQKA